MYTCRVTIHHVSVEIIMVHNKNAKTVKMVMWIRLKTKMAPVKNCVSHSRYSEIRSFEYSDIRAIRTSRARCKASAKAVLGSTLFETVDGGATELYSDIILTQKRHGRRTLRLPWIKMDAVLHASCSNFLSLSLIGPRRESAWHHFWRHAVLSTRSVDLS